nr:nucleotide sugar dehydrogenase [Geomicrobium halophilum]
MGLGYVGLPLAISIAEAGFKVIGIDIDTDKVQYLNEGNSYINDIDNRVVQDLIIAGNLEVTSTFSAIKELDALCVCVPTPLNQSQIPDMSFIQTSVEQIKPYMKTGLLITLESTTYPGTTDELLKKEIEKDGLSVGEDFFLCYSPERVDPGNKEFSIGNTPKVIGGITSFCKELGISLYKTFVDEVVPVSTTKVAEMSKLLENTFRSINIAFINEMAMLSEKLEIDIWETIEAANSKPFGYMKFSPGPGIGGHCIPLDPMYLSWKAKEQNFHSHFIDLAQEVNKKMPDYTHQKISIALNEHTKSIKGSKILLLGITYKPDIDDVRESPALDLYEKLIESGALVSFYDPYVNNFRDKKGEIIQRVDINYSDLINFDCAVLFTHHSHFELDQILYNSNLIVDTRNGFKDYNSEKVYILGSKEEKNKVLI